MLASDLVSPGFQILVAGVFLWSIVMVVVISGLWGTTVAMFPEARERAARDFILIPIFLAEWLSIHLFILYTGFG